MIHKRQIRAQRRAAQERDHAWQSERDQDNEQDGTFPADEHTTNDEFADMAREFQG